MAKFIQTVRSVLLIVLVITELAGCDNGEKEKAPPAPAVKAAPALIVGGSTSGLSGSGLVLQLNGANDLAVNTNGRFNFPNVLAKGSSYAVTVKSFPSAPIKQTCTVGQGSGNIVAPVNNIVINCITNSFAVGGTVSGLSGKGLALQLNGATDLAIEKNGKFIFPGILLPDGSDYSVAIKSAPGKQKCDIRAVNAAFDRNTLNIVAITCSKKGRRK